MTPGPNLHDSASEFLLISQWLCGWVENYSERNQYIVGDCNWILQDIASSVIKYLTKGKYEQSVRKGLG